MSKSVKTEQSAPPAQPAAADPGIGAPEALSARIAAVSGAKPAPVDTWNPPFCGDLDIRIARDGTWFYLGTPIGREKLVKLFASVLRRDEDGRHYLVTPVEKVGITVDDAPFVVVDFETRGAGRAREIDFTTALGDAAPLGPDHLLRIEGDDEPVPYVRIRGRLDGRVDRKTVFRLADLAEPGPDGATLGVWSRGVFFSLEPSEAARDR